ncbi:MAG: hypothetical protein ACR2MT_09135 [Aurantibacter sp.]
MKKLTTLIFVLCLFASFNNDDALEGPPTLVGFLYTTTNGENTNQLIKIDRFSDGSLLNEIAYSTNSLGGANTGAGGDAKGDFDAQNAIQIIGDYLLNVNAGGNTISVFSIDRPTGGLTFKNNVSSGGNRPVSIAFTKKEGNNNSYWVVVGNQWNNPNVQKDGANIERYPNDAFHAANMGQSDESDAARNIVLFSFDASNGNLTPEKVLDTYVRKNGGPTCISFSDDGTKLGVSTWGIAHFSTEVTSLDEQHPSRVYVYDFAKGTISGERYFEEEGIAGSIGFNWAKASNNILHVSNFNLIPSKRNNSLTVLNDNGTTVAKSGNYNTAGTEDIDEACWTLLNADGDKLYVASFGANVISAFDIDRFGKVASNATATARGDNAPAGDTKDMYITPDSKYLYVLGAFQSFSINRFDISTSGKIKYKDQTPLATTSAYVGKAGTYNFLGLAGYDLE